MTLKATARADAWKSAGVGRPVRLVKADVRRESSKSVQLPDHLATAVRPIGQIDDPNPLEPREDVASQERALSRLSSMTSTMRSMNLAWLISRSAC